MDQSATDQLYEAFAVLAGSDPDHCSYPQGYVKRQAVFACHTCVRDGMEAAGVCLACANTCHDGHDVSELYTKRSFRCDCGNDKFLDFRCRLHADKEGQNARNAYNHNYSGRYCSCDRPYPDADDQVNDEMIQCVVCEDWFHEKHLQAPAVHCDALMEMVCAGCMNRASFLWTYAAHFAVSPLKTQVSTDKGTDFCSSEAPSCREEPTTGGESVVCGGGQPHSEAVRCVFTELKAKDVVDNERGGSVFWPYHWRAKLCTCTDCKRMYVEASVPFLLDESDTLLAYEEKAKTEALMSGELLLSCLSSLSHQQQLDVLYRLNDLKQDLHEFLQQNKDVTPEDFQQFLNELQDRKRGRLD